MNSYGTDNNNTCTPSPHNTSNVLYCIMDALSKISFENWKFRFHNFRQLQS